jgi:hypothetical protein
LSLSLISVKRRTSYPVMMEQHNKLHTEEPQEVCKQKSPRSLSTKQSVRLFNS